MTCIAAVTDGTTVTMGADSAGVSGFDLTVRADAKVFVNGDFLLGCCGSFRQAQLLRYKFVPPECWDDDPMRYLVCGFIEEVRKCLGAGGVQEKDKGVETTQGSFLVGYRGHIYCIYSDYQVGESLDDFEAIGSGHSYARGSLYTTYRLLKNGVKGLVTESGVRVHQALEAAAHLNGGVCPPFTILHST